MTEENKEILEQEPDGAEASEVSDGQDGGKNIRIAGPNERHKWYVVHIMSGHEDKVRERIMHMRVTEGVEEYVSECLVPTENVSSVKGGKKRIRARKFFPGYALVRMELTDEVWHFIKNISGVLGFIGNKPAPLRESEIGEILTQLEEKKEKVKPKVLYEVGELLKVTDGPFVNFGGVVEETYPDKGKLKIMVSIFGRSTPVELEYWQVERA